MIYHLCYFPKCSFIGAKPKFYRFPIFFFFWRVGGIARNFILFLQVFIFLLTLRFVLVASCILGQVTLYFLTKISSSFAFWMTVWIMMCIPINKKSVQRFSRSWISIIPPSEITPALYWIFHSSTLFLSLQE